MFLRPVPARRDGVPQQRGRVRPAGVLQWLLPPLSERRLHPSEDSPLSEQRDQLLQNKVWRLCFRTDSLAGTRRPTVITGSVSTTTSSVRRYLEPVRTSAPDIRAVWKFSLHSGLQCSCLMLRSHPACDARSRTLRTPDCCYLIRF